MTRRHSPRAAARAARSRGSPSAPPAPSHPVSEQPARRRPADLLTALLCGLAAVAAYVFTLTDTVSGGDSGELISVAYHVGVAHPPGYPLYTLLAKVSTLIPLGGIAWRVSLFSALCDAAAAAVLCRAVISWTGSRSAGVLAAGAFAFSPLVWPYAIAAEVRSEEHTSELQSRLHLVCRLLLE